MGRAQGNADGQISRRRKRFEVTVEWVEADEDELLFSVESSMIEAYVCGEKVGYVEYYVFHDLEEIDLEIEPAKYGWTVEGPFLHEQTDDGSLCYLAHIMILDEWRGSNVYERLVAELSSLCLPVYACFTNKALRERWLAESKPASSAGAASARAPSAAATVDGDGRDDQQEDALTLMGGSASAEDRSRASRRREDERRVVQGLAPRFRRVASGDYETADGHFRLLKLDGGATQAWNVELADGWISAWVDEDPENRTPYSLTEHGIDDLPVDGARTKADALALFQEWWQQHPEQHS